VLVIRLSILSSLTEFYLPVGNFVLTVDINCGVFLESCKPKNKKNIFLTCNDQDSIVQFSNQDREVSPSIQWGT
jgi:hypothetical protein